MDRGLSMLMGDLITTIQEKLPIKIAVSNNGSLGFVELEMKAEGLLDSYTNLDNPDFARVAQAIGLHAQRVEHADALENAVRDWLGAPGPALRVTWLGECSRERGQRAPNTRKFWMYR